MIKIPQFRYSLNSPNEDRSTTSAGIRGLQERNKRNLLDVLQAATPIIEEMAKVKPETWRSMSGLFTALESTFGTGVRAVGQGFLTPFNMAQNRAMSAFEGFLAPVMVGINRVASEVESLALQNQQGAITGAAVGYVLSFILPGGPLLWSMVFGGVGAATESLGLTFGDPRIDPNFLDIRADILNNDIAPTIQYTPTLDVAKPRGRTFGRFSQFEQRGGIL